jgi:hypothetical protein
MLELHQKPIAWAENRQRMEAQLSVLEDRAKFLPDGDKTLVRLYLRGELHNRQMAQLLGINPSTLCRRVRRWIKRLNDPVVAVLIDRPTGLSDQQHQIAMGFFLMGHTRRELAKQFQSTPFEIAQVISFVRGWCKGIKMTR